MQTWKSPVNIYLFIVMLTGIGVYIWFGFYGLTVMPNWTLTITLITAVLLLNHYTIPLPPEGNALSFDSAVYLACIFLFNLSFTLNLVILQSLVSLIYQRKIAWWKHLFNFVNYNLMIIGAYFSFSFLNGNTGHINYKDIGAYVCSLTIYFLINMLLASMYFFLSNKASFSSILKLIIRDTGAAYLSTLLFSLVLGILIEVQHTLGIVLFVSIGILLSLAFKQHFELYQEVSKKANRDYLTGLSNHGFFKAKLDEEVRIANKTHRSLSLALLDIDDFKKYNDLYGHLQGDQLLKFFGSLLESNANMHNYFVARYGGEEFVILMPNTTAEQAYTFMERLRKNVNDSYFDGVELLRYHCLSFSAGVAEYERGVYDSQELLNKADQAMYYAKDQGKNMVHIANKQSKSLSQQNFSYDKQIQDLEQQLHIFLSKDVYTYRHSKRVFQYAVDFSDKLQLGDAEKNTLILGALIHDIGKLEIPRDIINKKEELDPHEWEIMKKHVLWGKEIISVNKELQELIPLVELHHERFDGKGYPYGLKGEDIPILARILCIIDSFDAMTTERPYQQTKTFSEAIEELRACSGQQFDPQFVEPFIDMITTCYHQKLKLEQAAMDILHETSEAN